MDSIRESARVGEFVLEGNNVDCADCIDLGCFKKCVQEIFELLRKGAWEILLRRVFVWEQKLNLLKGPEKSFAL